MMKSPKPLKFAVRDGGEPFPRSADPDPGAAVHSYFVCLSISPICLNACQKLKLRLEKHAEKNMLKK